MEALITRVLNSLRSPDLARTLALLQRISTKDDKVATHRANDKPITRKDKGPLVDNNQVHGTLAEGI